LKTLRLRLWGAASFAAGYILAGAALCAPPAAPARPELPAEGVVTSPDWVSRPSGDDVAQYYPTFAQFFGLTGEGKISCSVTTEGSLTDCRVYSEVPVGFGFGDAAIKMSALFRMKPETLDGVPVGGARVNIPIVFRLPESDGNLVSEPLSGSEPTSDALTLGRKLAAFTVDVDEQKARVEKAAESFSGAYAPDTHEKQLALEAWKQAQFDLVENELDQMAGYYARKISIAEMLEIAKFIGSPVGQDWKARESEAHASEISTAQNTTTAMKADAKARLCRQIACTASDSPSPDNRQP
jgi:TonB family protein